MADIHYSVQFMSDQTMILFYNANLFLIFRTPKKVRIAPFAVSGSIFDIDYSQ